MSSEIIQADSGLPVFQGQTLEDHVTAWKIEWMASEDKQWRLGAIAASLVGYYSKMVKQFALAVGVDSRTIRRYASVYKFYEVGQRCPSLTWAHHLTSLDAADPEAALQEAADNDYSVREMKQAISREPVIDIEAVDIPETCRVISDLEEIKGELFSTIYLDPPWQYGNQGTRAATNNHYDTMSMDGLIAMPVGELADENSHLWMWVTVPFLPDGLRLLSAWGFTYKTNFAWCKRQMGIGNYLRVSHEHLLLGVKGTLRTRAFDQMSWDVSDRGEHSAKPEKYRDMVERLSPGPYLELFGRMTRPQWTIYGNQVWNHVGMNEMTPIGGPLFGGVQ